MKDVEVGEDVGFAGLLFVHGGGDVQRAKLACFLYMVVVMCKVRNWPAALTPLLGSLLLQPCFPGPGLAPSAAASRLNSRRLCAVTAPQIVADPAVAGTCVPSTASTLRV